MADIEHAVVADPQIHEPKGVASAANTSVYVSNGIGSGDWLVPDTVEEAPQDNKEYARSNAGWVELPPDTGSLPYLFDTNNIAADPGVGSVRLNSGAQVDSTEIYLSYTDSFGRNNGSLIKATISVGDRVAIFSTANPDNFSSFDITIIADQGAWTQYTVTPSSSGGTLRSNNDPVTVVFQSGSAPVSQTFLELLDTPNDYSTRADEFIRVTPGEDGWEYKRLHSYGHNHIHENITSSNIIAVDTPTLLTIGWESPVGIDVTWTGTGFLIPFDGTYSINFTAIALKIGGGSASYDFNFYLNGSPIATAAKSGLSIDSTSFQSCGVETYQDLTNGDVIQIFMTNLTNSDDILVTESSFSCKLIRED